MLRGNAPATIDEKGRLKVPVVFRRTIEKQYGAQFFVTSIDGMGVRLYPLPIWKEIEDKISSLPSFNPAVARLLDAVSYFGAEVGLDGQGRLLIQQKLRDSADMRGEVAVLGKQTFLEVWNDERFRQRLQANPLSEEDRRQLSGLGL
jgi:transcriptional regulator MraZ